MTKREPDELTLIEDNITVNEKSRTVWFQYPLIKDPVLLSDNWAQAIAMEKRVQEKLLKNGLLEAYNDVIREYIERGVFRLLSKEEMDDWDKAVNYVTHHGVPKPSSTTTAIRVVCNSSLDNNNRGISFNDLLPKGPNALEPLLQVLTTWRTHKEVVIWDYSKAYHTIYTFAEEMHMRRLVWRFNPEDPWVTYVVNRMNFGDRVATTALEVAKRKVADVGEVIDLAANAMIKKGYSDDGVAGGTKQDVAHMMGEC